MEKSTRSKTKKINQSPVNLLKSTKTPRTRSKVQTCRQRNSKEKSNLKEKIDNGVSKSRNRNKKPELPLGTLKNQSCRSHPRKVTKANELKKKDLSPLRSPVSRKVSNRHKEEHSESRNLKKQRKRQKSPEDVNTKANGIKLENSCRKRRQLKIESHEEGTISIKRGNRKACKKEDTEDKLKDKPNKLKERKRFKREESDESDESDCEGKTRKKQREKHVRISKLASKILTKRAKNEEEDLIGGLIATIQGFHEMETKLGKWLRVVDEKNGVQYSKRPPNRPDKESLEGTPKKKRCSRKSSGRLNTDKALEMIKFEKNSAEDVMREEGFKGFQYSLKGELSREELIAYHEEMIKRLRGIPEHKEEKKFEGPQTEIFKGYNVTRQCTENEMDCQQEEPKTEDQEENTKVLNQRAQLLLINNNESLQNRSKSGCQEIGEKIEEDTMINDDERKAVQGLVSNASREETEEKIEEGAKAQEQEEDTSAKTEPKIEEQEQMNEEKSSSDQPSNDFLLCQPMLYRYLGSSEDGRTNNVSDYQEKSKNKQSNGDDKEWNDENISVKEEGDQEQL